MIRKLQKKGKKKTRKEKIKEGREGEKEVEEEGSEGRKEEGGKSQKKWYKVQSTYTRSSIQIHLPQVPMHCTRSSLLSSSITGLRIKLSSPISPD